MVLTDVLWLMLEKRPHLADSLMDFISNQSIKAQKLMEAVSH